MSKKKPFKKVFKTMKLATVSKNIDFKKGLFKVYLKVKLIKPRIT